MDCTTVNCASQRKTRGVISRFNEDDLCRSTQSNGDTELDYDVWVQTSNIHNQKVGGGYMPPDVIVDWFGLMKRVALRAPR